MKLKKNIDKKQKELNKSLKEFSKQNSEISKTLKLFQITNEQYEKTKGSSGKITSSNKTNFKSFFIN
jgi:hypothetical protein